MRIISLLPILAFGDAVGNDALTIHNCLKDSGFECEIAACNVDQRILDRYSVRIVHDTSFIKDDDLVIYHFSTGHYLNIMFGMLKCKKILRYHNITPPHFFCGYNPNLVLNCIQGYRELKQIRNHVEYCIADSNYNKSELIRLGYRCPIDVVPIVIPFEDYIKKPNDKVLKKYQNDSYTNFLFTGRISPNKRQEEIIAVFHEYQKLYNPNSRLFFVGKYEGMERYYEKLQEYVDKIGAENVFFTGHIPFDEILAYYQLADLFICMSDHEGFCVPLIEAMCFEIPIVAKAVAAVPETMGGGGIAIKSDSSFTEIAGVCDIVLRNEDIKSKIYGQQKICLRKLEKQNIVNNIIQKCRLI